ncbi:MAG: N-acetylmuramoyl-L-alanine amidase [Oscillospiraceae bacterium]
MLLIFSMLFGGGIAAIRETAAIQTLSPAQRGKYPVIIDPGHGGEDGGAVSRNGTIESNINLAIGLKLDAIFALYGISADMTRREDRSIHDDTASTLRQKKVSDLHNRVAMIERTPGTTLISIHQNKFTNPAYHGAQVFFANPALSLPLATITQDTLRILDPKNHRLPAKIPDQVYLMRHITCRAILVECGFLSNLEEDLRLNTDAYQTKIAASLAASYLNLIQTEEGAWSHVAES